DNGNVNDDKTLYLAFSLAAMGSTATISATYDTLLINIFNDDSVPTVGGPEYHTLNAGSLVTSNLTSGFTGASKRGHSQFLLDVSELTAAGVRAGVPITQLAFNITTRYSSTAYVNYTVSMGNTTVADLSSGYASAPTTVFSGNHTTNTGWDSLNFSTPFIWDGTSKVVVDVCYGANASSATNNDQMQGISHSSFICTNYNGSNSGSGSGCSLAFNSSNASATRPVMRFKQQIPPTPIETANGSTRVWNVRSGQQVYYYTPTGDTNLIAATLNPTADLGCVNTTISQAGTGFAAASFISGNRSLKEITITPTTGTSSSCDVIFYMTNAELSGTSPSTLYLLHTTASTDAGITTANTTINTPTLITGSAWVGFKSNFSGYGRYFLTNAVFCTPPTATITAGGATTFCTGGSVVLTASSGTGLYLPMAAWGSRYLRRYQPHLYCHNRRCVHSGGACRLVQRHFGRYHRYDTHGLHS
ncbi:MAG: hypothetical protein EBZ77_06440, partial [Chitinophagia bacterium]|nr:hypothetical protein [Chitinophagia bacterium]